ncbi:MAG TPA: hypothetical protein PLQ81_02855 [bacterium]|nr:hypothetical protein [bacterium]
MFFLTSGNKHNRKNNYKKVDKTIKEYMPNDDSIKSFLKDLFKSTADISPDYYKKILLISVHNLSTKEFDNIARYLMKTLNDSDIKFPDTNLTIFYKLVSD